MPEAWSSSFGNDSSSLIPKVTIEEQNERQYSPWDYDFNLLDVLELEKDEGNNLFEKHLDEYRKYVNRLSYGGWYTSKIDSTCPESYLDHLYTNPLKKVGLI